MKMTEGPGTEKRMFSRARIDVLTFRLRSHCHLIAYSANCQGKNFTKIDVLQFRLGHSCVHRLVVLWPGAFLRPILLQSFLKTFSYLYWSMAGPSSWKLLFTKQEIYWFLEISRISNVGVFRISHRCKSIGAFKFQCWAPLESSVSLNKMQGNVGVRAKIWSIDLTHPVLPTFRFEWWQRPGHRHSEVVWWSREEECWPTKNPSRAEWTRKKKKTFHMSPLLKRVLWLLNTCMMGGGGGGREGEGGEGGGKFKKEKGNRKRLWGW